MKDRNVFLPAKPKLYEGWRSLLALPTKNLVDEHSALQLVLRIRSFDRKASRNPQDDRIFKLK